MSEDQMTGRGRNAADKTEEASARKTGEARTEAEGATNQLKGTAQDVYDQARKGVSDLADVVRGSTSSFEGLVRNTIEQQPYKAVAIALGIGCFLGRLHRPL